ncbi:BgTH12-03261 [Blumeria graminis f. sp. triticale]|nr:BgTH12-03261 [Blumeria graminis f. sp. triticale]
MVFNIVTVAGAAIPTICATFFAHFIYRQARAQKPTSRISYDEGVALIRKFLVHASHHTVEELQKFTAQWLPHPPSVKVDIIHIEENFLQKSAEAIQIQLGKRGIERVGGKLWWQWRMPGDELTAEWVEMKSDYNQRISGEHHGKTIMLYVHGGAYFFGSVNEHRYQLQKHARKLKARVLAPNYRLAPQYPFPCGLQDCLAIYMYLLTIQDASSIILAGDSAGGGMILSILVILRDQGVSLPAGAILISPWVDLTHSFPSVAQDNPYDYIPSHGFLHKPSISWPPPSSDEVLAIEDAIGRTLMDKSSLPKYKETGPKPVVIVDGEPMEIKDQIHMYATNEMLHHPLISPVFQPSLGGLPPLMILTGGGEVLRDEQIYIAHKAANPTKYPTGPDFFEDSEQYRLKELTNRWAPTKVQLQVWSDLCHVAPTLSFTLPAKYMFRSMAQFGTWAITQAQQENIDNLDSHDESYTASFIGNAGDPLPRFRNNMIRERVDHHGKITSLEPESEIAACKLHFSKIGVVNAEMVVKWLTAKLENDKKFATLSKKIQKQRIKEYSESRLSIESKEFPPLTALACRR